MGKRLVLLAGLALVVAGLTATAIREASTGEESARLATMLDVAKQRAREAGVEPDSPRTRVMIYNRPSKGDRALMARLGLANGPYWVV
jgi:hypothetical protein